MTFESLTWQMLRLNEVLIIGSGLIMSRDKSEIDDLADSAYNEIIDFMQSLATKPDGSVDYNLFVESINHSVKFKKMIYEAHQLGQAYAINKIALSNLNTDLMTRQ